MDNSILIPNVTCDCKVGSVFNHLFDVIAATEGCGGNVVWDFREASSLHPFLLGPLSVYKDQSGYPISCLFSDGLYSQKYLEVAHFDTPLDMELSSNEDVAKGYLGKQCTPICRFSGQSSSERAQRFVERIIKMQIDGRLSTPLSYFLSELICNVNEHSLYGKGYLFAQILPEEDTLCVCIADDGITIYGSYVSSNKYLSEITSEASAVKMATLGFSTKNLPFAENRGYGISTTTQMLVDGLGGSMFILSGTAFHRHDRNASQYVNLPSEINWDGTMVLLCIPLSVPGDFNYIEFIS